MQQYLDYAKHLGASEEVTGWIETTLKKRLAKPDAPDQGEVEHVLDYLCSEQRPRKLKRMSYPQAEAKAKAWMKTMKKKGRDVLELEADVETLHTFADGARIVRLIGQAAYQREGHLMSHCVASYHGRSDIEIYSYRDKKNEPHATFEVVRGGQEIQQIKGKGNGPIHPRYIEPILAFLETLGKRPRPSEMRYLGYYHIQKEQIEMLNQHFDVQLPIQHLFGEAYVYDSK